MALDKGILAGSLFFLLLAVLLWKSNTFLIETWNHETEDGIKYLGSKALYVDLWIKCIALVSVERFIHGISKTWVSDEVNRKKESIGFVGAQPHSYAAPWYFEAIDTLGKDLEIFPCLKGQIERQNGLSHKVLRSVFDGGLSSRIFKLSITLSKLVLNSAFMCMNLLTLPPRDPKLPLNQARYYVLYFEATIMAYRCLKLAYLLLRGTMAFCGWPYRGFASSIARSLEKASEWSAFQMLRHLNTAHVGKLFDDRATECDEFGVPSLKFLVAGCQLLSSIILYGGLGMMAMAVKLSQLSFVEEKLVQDYDYQDVIKVLGFTLNMVSIFDIADIEMASVKRLLIQDKEYSLTSCAAPSPLWTAWELHLADQLQQCMGSFHSFVIVATMTANDVRKLLIEQEERLPNLYFQMLAMHEDELLQNLDPVAKVFIYSGLHQKRRLIVEEDRVLYQPLKTENEKPLLETEDEKIGMKAQQVDESGPAETSRNAVTPI